MTEPGRRPAPRAKNLALLALFLALIVMIVVAIVLLPSRRAVPRPSRSAKPTTKAYLPTYTVLRAAGPITIDGRLDEPTWAGLRPVSSFVIHDGTHAATALTEAKLCWDDRNLYVTFTCADKDLRAKYTKRDDPVCRDDAVEVFLCPTNNLTDYYEFEVNPRNAVWDGKDHNPDLLPNKKTTYDDTWNCSGLLTAVHADGTFDDSTDIDEGWTVEMAIPFAGMNRKTPVVGERWRANLFRIEFGASEEYDAWSPPQNPGEPPAFHVPSRFGSLIFSGRAAAASAPNR